MFKRRRSNDLNISLPWPKEINELEEIDYFSRKCIVARRLLERGVVVSLEGDLDGFVPLSQLAIDGLKNPRQSFDEGQELPIEVIEFDEEQKKIVLSVREFFKDKDQAEYETYLEAHPLKEVAIEEAAADKDDEMESWGDGFDGEAPAADAAPATEEVAGDDDE